MHALVVDIGNSRIKTASVNPARPAAIVDPFAVPLDAITDWRDAVRERGGFDVKTRWLVSSVNPVAAKLVQDEPARHGVTRVRWFTSASDVPIKHAIKQPGQAGADRALAVLAARSALDRPCSLIVVLCGTAITVEACDASGTWLGGAIATGYATMARALALGTALLPEIARDCSSPPPWGDNTRAALAAGLHWSVVGAVRELVSRQSALLGDPPPAVLWSGGDAAWIAREVEGPAARIEPDLVLRGLASIAHDENRVHLDTRSS